MTVGGGGRNDHRGAGEAEGAGGAGEAGEASTASGIHPRALPIHKFLREAASHYRSHCSHWGWCRKSCECLLSSNTRPYQPSARSSTRDLIVLTFPRPPMQMILIAFSDTIDQIGTTETLLGESVTSRINDTLKILAYVGAGLFFGRLIYFSLVDYVCQCQLLKYKRAYLKAVLRQDVSWYDASKPEEISVAFTSAMTKVQKGLAAPAFMLFEGIGYGTAGFALGFFYEAEVAGVTLATVPLLILPATVMMSVVENGAKAISGAYSTAGGIATEVPQHICHGSRALSEGTHLGRPWSAQLQTAGLLTDL